ncbi:MAG: hypothetical protein COT16_01460 [Elusimicrobia bacterium CG08_land_8_20_14_0_20_44_26]|nr:MAG: hypothetical protein COT16_01460 [Elusimicrobia bacterium CG08_land_8_20_14_0_20_44_26]
MKLELSMWYKILAPRSVVLVSTVNNDGVSNAAPFSFVMPVSTEPPMIAFASDPGHHTVKNIKMTGDFVVNIPGADILDKLWTCAKSFAYGVSEIEKAGLTEEKSENVKSPRIKESIGFFECKLSRIEDIGDHVLIIGDVLLAGVKDKFFSGGKYLIKKANPLIHIGGPEFALIGEIVKNR